MGGKVEDERRGTDGQKQQIEQHQSGTSARAKREGLGAVGNLEELVTLEPAHLRDQGPDIRVVLDDEDAMFAPAGE